MSYSSPESLLLLRQQLVVGLWLNILCLLVERVLNFLHVQVAKQSFKNYLFRACFHHRVFFYLGIVLLKTTYKTNLSEISLCYTACLGMSSRKQVQLSFWLVILPAQ